MVEDLNITIHVVRGIISSKSSSNPEESASVLLSNHEEMFFKAVLNDLGAGKITHWDARKKSSIHRMIKKK